MALPTPRSKSPSNVEGSRPRAHVVFWRAFPNKEIYPADPDGKCLFVYNLEMAGTGATTMGYYMRKGFRPIEISVNMPQNKKGPIIEMIENQLMQVIPLNRAEYEKARKAFKPEMIANIIDEAESERRASMNANLRNAARAERMKQVHKDGTGGTVAEQAGLL